MSLPNLCLQSVPVGCASLCVGVPVPLVSPAPRKTADGHAACERCGRQLSKVKHHHRHGPGHACHPRCKPREQPLKDEAAPVAAAAPPLKQSRKRRAQSDPGESPEPTAPQALTRRVTPPQPASTSRKQYNTRREEQIMRLLDETVARRMAAEEADAASNGGTAHH